MVSLCRGDIIMPEGAKPGDVLLLTKALGTQVRLTKKKVGVSGQKTTFYLRLPSHLNGRPWCACQPENQS